MKKIAVYSGAFLLLVATGVYLWQSDTLAQEGMVYRSVQASKGSVVDQEQQ